MTDLIEYDTLPRGGSEPVRIIEDDRHLSITKRAGSWKVVNTDGRTVMDLDELGEEHRIKGEVRFG